MKKALTYILFAAALLALLCGAAQAEPWAGSGTAADPYIISSAADLAAMREYVAAEGYPGGLVFKLGADIDLGEYCGPARGSWTPIRVPDTFDGIFDGGGHTITGLYINRPDLEKVGLFNATGTGAGGTIKNLTVEGEVTGGSLTGGIIGSLTCEMVNCSFIGTVEGTDKVGGIAGYNGGVIDNCRVSGTVTGSGDEIGGIAGLNGLGTLRSCTFQNGGSVTGDEMVGGIAGSCMGELIENCISYGTIDGGKYIGGIVGGTIGPVQECLNYGLVTGAHWVGGVTGYSFSEEGLTGTVSNCRNYGRIHAYGDDSVYGQLVGGIVGVAMAPVIGCENRGPVEGDYYSGGIVGDLESDLHCCNSYVNETIAGVVFDGRTLLTLRSNDSSKIVTYSILRTIPPSPFAGSDGEFYAWNTAADGSGTYYFEGTKVSYKDPLELYAIRMNGTIDTSYRALNGETVNVQAAVLRDGTYHLADGWYAVPYDIVLNERLTFTGSVNLILCDGAQLHASKGIGVPAGASLTIWDQQSGSGRGRLTASGESGFAGIGGNDISGQRDCGTVTINGGCIEAAGGNYGAGIGGGDTGSGGTVVINDGVVTAAGRNGAAGIGGGDYAGGGSVTINGGSVTARGSARSTTGQGAAGIGAGRPKTDGSQSLSGGSVVINGGSVYAEAGGNDANAIGANTQYSTPGSLTIADGLKVQSPLAGDDPVFHRERTDTCRLASAAIDPCENHAFYQYNCYSCGIPMYVQDIFAGKGGENEPLLIQSEEDWNMLASLYSEGRLDYNHYWYRLTQDISVTAMLGTEEHPFNAAFDGAGHTLTFNAENTDHAQCAAPFAWVDGVTVLNLRTAGSITGAADRASGLIGEASGSTVIENCRVSMSLSGRNHVSAFCIGDRGGLTLKGCVFDGSLSTGNRSGGFVGCTGGSLTIQDCLFAPASAAGTGNVHTFYFDEDGTHPAALTGSFWLTAYGSAQGRQAFAVSAGEGVTVDCGTPGTAYDVSGITVYPAGLMYSGSFFAGEGESLALGLSADPWEGYTLSFTADASTLTAADTGWVLTVPSQNTVISARYTPAFATSPAVHLTSDGGTNGYNDQDPDKLFDGLDSTKWCAAFSGTDWVEFRADTPVLPAAYAMTTGGDAQKYPRRNPVSWRLLGRLSPGDSWTVLAEETDNRRLPAANSVQIFFPLTVPGSYRYYRLEVTAVREGSQLQLAEFTLIGTPVFGTPDFILPAGLTAIGESAFEGAAATIAEIPDGCASIGSHAFSGCPNLTEIRIPASVTDIGTELFSGCTHTVHVFGTAGSEAEAYCLEHAGCVFVAEQETENRPLSPGE